MRGAAAEEGERENHELRRAECLSAEIPAPPRRAAGPDAAVPAAAAGGRRTRSAAGISRVQATMPIVIIAVRQS